MEVSVRLRIEEDDLKRFHRFGMVSAYRRYDSWYRDFCRKLPSYEPDGEASGGVLVFDFSANREGRVRYSDGHQKNNAYILRSSRIFILWIRSGI